MACTEAMREFARHYKGAQQKPNPSPGHKLPPSLTFLSVNVIQEVDGVLHHTIADIAVISSRQKGAAVGQNVVIGILPFST